MKETNKRKIAISTWYMPSNYGTGLQALALARYCELLGNKVYFVKDNRKKEEKNDGLNEQIQKVKKKLYKIASGEWNAQRKKRVEIEVRENLQQQFINDYISVFYLNTDDDVKKINEKMDVFVAGGDQIWNPYVLEDINLLSFTSRTAHKISYGTSVGVADIPEKYREIYINNLSDFSKISVREMQSKKALQKFLDKKIEIVVDPTLLFDEKGWAFLLEKAKIDETYKSKKYILCYFVGNRKSYWKYVEKIKKETGLEVVYLPIRYEGFKNPHSLFVSASPAEFLWLIKNAEIICTDSFHATLFSIQFQKEFYVLKRFKDTSQESQNGRLSNLLKTINLFDRMIQNENFYERKSEIDYKPVMDKLEKERKFSQQWLQNALEI